MQQNLNDAPTLPFDLEKNLIYLLAPPFKNAIQLYKVSMYFRQWTV